MFILIGNFTETEDLKDLLFPFESRRNDLNLDLSNVEELEVIEETKN